MREEILKVLRLAFLNILVKKGSPYDLGKNCFEWRDKPLNEDEFPAMFWNDTLVSYDDDSGHVLKIEAVVAVRGVVSDEVAKETRVAMQSVAHTFRDALLTMGYFGKMLKSEMIGEDKDYRYIAGRLSFEIRYTDDEWSV